MYYCVALSQEPKSRKEIMKEVVAKSKQMKVLILHCCREVTAVDNLVFSMSD